MGKTLQEVTAFELYNFLCSPIEYDLVPNHFFWPYNLTEQDKSGPNTAGILVRFCPEAEYEVAPPSGSRD